MWQVGEWQCAASKPCLPETCINSQHGRFFQLGRSICLPNPNFSGFPGANASPVPQIENCCETGHMLAHLLLARL